MQRDILPHLPVVLAVARRGGFAAAAKELGMSASAVSHSVRFVEDRLGLPLFARTTRSVSLTDWGQLLVDTTAPSITGIDEALERLKSAQGQVSGHEGFPAETTLPDHHRGGAILYRALRQTDIA